MLFLLIANIFEHFRDCCLKNCKLEPAHYLTAPWLAWDAIFKLPEVNLDLISDYELYFIIEKWIRGGIFQYIKRYSKANIKNHLIQMVGNRVSRAV